jgi:hypothetical protein
MKKTLKTAGFLLLLCLFGLSVKAEEINQEQVKGLDEQIQEIKGDVIAIAAELNLLEEKLLYPSHSQVALFVSVGSDEEFRLDSVSIELDGSPVADHIYSFKELEALQKGGVQRIYSGNIKGGEHQLRIRYRGVSPSGKDFSHDQQFSLSKGIEPCFGEIILTQQSAALSAR